MTITEVIPIIESLPHADKFKLMQLILSQLANEEGILLRSQYDSKQYDSKDDSLWDIVAIAEGEDAEIARHHDKYLYGVK